VLVGREAERAAVGRLLQEARTSRGGSLVLRGPPGVGKSALLEEVVAVGGPADGMTVLRTAGLESESPLAFAALHRLLRPLLSTADRLPPPQSAALRAAFGEAAPDRQDRFLVFLAALSLLAEAAEDAPVLALVDDAHWLDEASSAALLFVARRLQAERIALLFAAREGDVRSFEADDLPSLWVGGMTREVVAELVGRRAGTDVPAEVAATLTRATGGNPLALVELAGALSTEELTGRRRLPDPLPLTEGVERAFADRFRRLPAAARTLLLVAAADDSGRLATVRHAAAELGAGEDAVEEVERSGLLRVDGGDVRLRHPLVRSAVYGVSTSRQRRRAHLALADALGAGEEDRRVWHRAAAADEPDPAVVADLDAVAERARGRGGHEAAAAAWERAAELTVDPEPRAGRLFAAGMSAWLAGQPARARALTDAAHPLATAPGLRADIAQLRARVEWNTGSLQLGHRMVLQAAVDVAPQCPARARELAMFGAALASVGGDSGVAIVPTEVAPAPATEAPAREHCFAHLLDGLHFLSRGDMAAAVGPLRAAFADGASMEDADQDLVPNLGIAAAHLGDDAAVRDLHDLILARARGTGALVLVLYALTRRGMSDVATGEWAAARAGAAEALSLGESTGQPALTALPLTWLTLLAALRGTDDYAALLRRAESVAAVHELGTVGGLVHDGLRWARAVDAADQPETALRHLARMELPITQRLAAIDRVETAVRAGAPDQARHWVEELDAFAAATGNAWAIADAAHGHAVLAEPADAEPHFQRALTAHASSTRAVDRARTELAYGVHLRRMRRRVDARTHLRAALETFADLGARPWAEIATAELRASGETARRRVPSTATSLTPQEVQVATLVQQGMSNREVAAQLFLSPRTIDFHLRNVFTKLGISSRTELVKHRLG
jgi:DNA-binding NarL/FixJ family response regulator